MEDEPATEILEATYRALCAQGYADLTLEDVAAESVRSKAAIHYHYDDKDQLFLALLDELYDRYTDRLASATGETPGERLSALLAVHLTDDAGRSGRAFRTALLEMQAQAPYDDAVRDRLADFDDALVAQLRETLADGRDDGGFGEHVDPDSDAEWFAATIRGVHTRQVAVDLPADRLRQAMRRYATSNLSAADRPEATR